ncbi:MAG: hypothetical protein SFY68_13030 [Candidatus Sumerlaeia bacterium]|nr:hypothetical protein [Candidatus Sumerlaeia bacterium]
MVLSPLFSTVQAPSRLMVRILCSGILSLSCASAALAQDPAAASTLQKYQDNGLLPTIYQSPLTERESRQARMDRIPDVYRPKDPNSELLRSSFDARWGTLEQKDYEALSPEAKGLYLQASEYANFVDYKTAREKLAEAAAIDTNSIPLQFLLLKTSRRAAETSSGDESRRNYELASDALRRLTSNSNLTPEQRLQVGRDSERVREGIDSIEERDQKKLEDGFNFVLTVYDQRRERFENTFDTPTEPEIPTIEEVLNPPPPPVAELPAVPDTQIWSELQAPGLSLETIRAIGANAFNNAGFPGAQPAPGFPGADPAFDPAFAEGFPAGPVGAAPPVAAGGFGAPADPFAGGGGRGGEK